MFLKTYRVRKDGKVHIYYSQWESLRVVVPRMMQRRLPNFIGQPKVHSTIHRLGNA
jgi:hypothetical protein